VYNLVLSDRGFVLEAEGGDHVVIREGRLVVFVVLILEQGV
jgi:hypothetical protein